MVQNPIEGKQKIKTKNLVQEVGVGNNEDIDCIEIPAAAAQEATSHSKKESDILLKEVKSVKRNGDPVIKKGFLNKLSAEGKTSSLYPEVGSSEGAGGAKGGTYERFMSRCKVVDTSKLPVDGGHDSGKNSRSALNPPLEHHLKASSILKNSIVNEPVKTNPSLTKSQAVEKKKSVLTDTELNEMNGIFSNIDSDFGSSLEYSNKMKEADIMSDQLFEISKILGGGFDSCQKSASALESALGSLGHRNSNGTVPSHVAKNSVESLQKDYVTTIIQNFKIVSDMPDPIQFTIIEDSSSNLKAAITLSVLNITPEQIKDADLKISNQIIELSLPSVQISSQTRISLRLYSTNPKFIFDKSQTSAKMSKKKCKIEITTSKLV